MATIFDSLRERARERLNSLQDRVVEFDRAGGFESLAERVAERLREEEEKLSTGRSSLNPDYVATVRLWYARLELPYGAGADEVRAAFRGLMRRYHPDRFAGDAESEALATELSQRLSVAYEGLLQHLGTR